LSVAAGRLSAHADNAPGSPPVPDQTPADTLDNATRQAVAAITTALNSRVDVAEFLAHALCYVAAAEGGIEEVLRNRPGSWEAEHVRRLMEGTAGLDGEHLDNYRD
jgi:hypothetical protein